MARRTDPSVVWEAYRNGHRSLMAWLAEVPDADWERPTVLPGWSIVDLAAHIGTVAESITALERAPRGAAASSLEAYIRAYAPIAEIVAGTARTLADAAGRDRAAVLALVEERFTAAEAVIAEVGLREQVVSGRRGLIKLSDYLLTRVVEVVVHADDAARSLPEQSEPVLTREIRRLAVRALLDALADRAPGRTVEVRVPPFAAVQCVEGLTHTRGTPPNVVEMSPLTWIRLATGRASWADEVAAARVSASGERADLSARLPLF